MTTIINNPNNEGSTATGIAATVILVLLILGLVYVFVLPTYVEKKSSSEDIKSDITLSLPSNDH